MMNIVVRTMCFLAILSLVSCGLQKNNDYLSKTGYKVMATQFKQAKPIWPTGQEREMNLTVGFRGHFSGGTEGPVVLRVAASTIYRVFLNGHYIGHGPARAAHGFYRMDEWPLDGKLRSGDNIVAVEVSGYNVNSYYLLDQPSFLQAEVVSGEQVLLATGVDENRFEATVLRERIRKVPRYSFQRPFVECYKLQPGYDAWRIDPSAPFEKVKCSIMPDKKIIARRVPHVDFKMRPPIAIHSTGKVRTGVKPQKYWKDRSLTKISDKLKGYKESELTINPGIPLQEIVISTQKKLNKPYASSPSIAMQKDSFVILDFGINLTGFIGATITCLKPTTLYFVFDEILTDNDVKFNRLGCLSAVTYELEPGTYNVESCEPYTMRYLKVIAYEGECEVKDVWLREYANSSIARSGFRCSNDKVNRIYQAARETFRQNAVDIFMDCPSRERAGWLGDSFFTARVAADLTGTTLVEKNFIENFLLPEKFAHIPPGMLPMCYPADHYDGVFIPNWALWFVVQLGEYLERTGDRALVDGLRSRVVDLFDYFEPFKNSDGLLEKLDGWIFVEWSKANKFVQDVNYPTNMLYASALATAGRLYDIPDYIREANEIRDVIRKQSFNGSFFVDNAIRDKNGKLRVTDNKSEICQYYAFFFDVASPETFAELWQTLASDFGPVRKEHNKYPDVAMANAFMGNYLRLELLSRYNRQAQLLDEIVDYFYYMARITGTLWENISANASCNHGFASHVAHVLYRDVLGVRKIDYQKKKIVIQFADLKLDNCEGKIPVGSDDLLEVKWWKKNGTLFYRVHLPDSYNMQVKNLSGLKLVRVTESEK